jgi:hypothetical protein
MLAHTATPRKEWKKAFQHLRHTIAMAKWEWAHNWLNKAADVRDIWRLTKTCKGRQTNTFPSLHNETNELVYDPSSKANLFRKCFFPEMPKAVQTLQDSDPAPKQTRTWDQITPEEVSIALKPTSNDLAPSLSGVGYQILK